MTLESLSSQILQRITLTDLSKPEFSAKQVYKKLAKSPFFTNKRPWLWCHSIDEEGAIVSDNLLFTDKALFHIVDNLIEGKNEAKSPVIDLYYDEIFQLWGDKQGSIWLASDQLFGVFISSFKSKEKAKKHFDRVKKSRFYDENSHLWNESVETLDMGSKRRKVFDQFLGVLVSSLFDKQEAKKQYDLFVNNPKNSPYPVEIFTDIELMDVLAQASFDQESARERFNNLKNSQLFNKDKQMWYQHLDVRTGVTKVYLLSTQLLGIWCEYLFEEKDSVRKPLTVPAKRSF